MEIHFKKRVLTKLLSLFGILMIFLGPRLMHALDPSKAFSQYLQMTWNYQNGLSQKTVNAVAQTREGFLWLATEEGLVRYDGKVFVTYDERNAPGLGDRLIRSLTATADGKLWIGTMTGLVRYDHGIFTSFRDLSNWRQDVFDLAVTPDGVWFSSSTGLRCLHLGADGMTGNVRNFTITDGLPSNGITGLAASPDGSLWIGTRAGLAHFSHDRFVTYGAQKAGVAKNQDIVTIALGKHNDVWVGKEDGTVDHWKGGQEVTAWQGAATHGSSVVSLREDSDGTVWVAFRKLGLGRLRNGKLELLTRVDNLPSIDPDWIFEDRERNLWVGWADAGLSMFRDGKFTLFGRAEGVSSDVISSVIQARDGDVLIGTEDAGLTLLSLSAHAASNTEPIPKSAFSVVSGLGEAGVMALLQQRDGTLWIGSDRGSVTRIINGRSARFRVPGTLTPGLPAMVEDAHGEPWFGFDMPNGLARLRGGRFKFERLPGMIKALATAPDGSLWIASYLGGLIHLKDGIFHVYTKQDGLSNLFLTSLHVDKDGTVWIGTFLGGLNRFKDGKFTHYSIEQGLSDSTIGAVVADKQGFLWLAGTRGIQRIKLQEFNEYAAGIRSRVDTQMFGYSDGLRSEECNFKSHPALLRDRDGRMWFATLSGLAMIDPSRIQPDRAVPQAMIEGIFVGNHAIPATASTIAIRPGESNLSIRFTAPTFVSPEKMQLRYRLIGLEEEWLDGQVDRDAVYATLPPRHYRFEMRVINSDGAIIGDLAWLEFDVLPHYYETWWFRLLVLMLVCAAIWLGFLLRTRYLVRNTERLEHLVLEKTVQVRSALDSAEAARDLLRDQATRDFLTGIWNRRAIFEILERELQRCQREGRPLAIIMADVDHFKNINDTWGHQVGDQVICEISMRIRQGIRSQDAVGRYGGEEMLILLPDCGIEQSVARAESLRVAISDAPILVDGFAVPVSCSFGLAHIHAGATSGEIVGQADAALYQAKRDGRNCVRLLEPIAN